MEAPNRREFGGSLPEPELITKYVPHFFRELDDHFLGDLRSYQIILRKNAIIFFQTRDRDQILDPIFRQGSRSNIFLKAGSRSDRRSYFLAEIEIGS